MTDDGGSRGSDGPKPRTRDEAIAELRAQAAQTDTVIDLRIVVPAVTAIGVGAAVIAGRTRGWPKLAALTVATLAGAWVAWVVILTAAFDGLMWKLGGTPDGAARPLDARTGSPG